MNHPINQMKMLIWGLMMGLCLWMLSPPMMAGIKTKPSDLLPLTEYEATYVLSWHGIKGGESKHSLTKRQDGLYHVSSVSEPFIKMLPFHYVEKTDFYWKNGEVVPRNYYYNIKEGRRHKSGNVFFDWQENKVFNKVSKEPWEAKIPDNVQDKLTHAVALRLDLMQKPRRNEYVYTVAEDDEIKPYTFYFLGEEKLKTRIGDLDTVVYKLITKEGRATYMWLAVNHQYLPVRVHHYKDGKKVGSGVIKDYHPSRT